MNRKNRETCARSAVWRERRKKKRGERNVSLSFIPPFFLCTRGPDKAKGGKEEGSPVSISSIILSRTSRKRRRGDKEGSHGVSQEEKAQRGRKEKKKGRKGRGSGVRMPSDLSPQKESREGGGKRRGKREEKGTIVSISNKR